MTLSAYSQGITGPVENVKWGGISANLLKGKTNAERWKNFQSHEQELLGKSELEVNAIFGKGGNGYEKNQKLYLLSDYKRKGRKPSGTATHLAINYVNGRVESYTVSLVH